MHKRKNKRSPNALAARAARKAPPAGVALASPASKKEKPKSASLLGRLTDTIADTGRAVLQRIEEIPGVKKAEELVGIRHEGRTT